MYPTLGMESCTLSFLTKRVNDKYYYLRFFPIQWIITWGDLCILLYDIVSYYQLPRPCGLQFGGERCSEDLVFFI